MDDELLTPDRATEVQQHYFMVIWCVTENPSDYPGRFVARPHLLSEGSPGIAIAKAVMLADDLDALRKMLPPGLTRFPRAETDDRVILESWM